MPRRAVRRSAVVVPALLSGLLAVPPVAARAEAVPSGRLASVAYPAGTSTEAPVGRAAIALASGDVAELGTLTARTTFGSVDIAPPTASPYGYLLVRSADGTTVRWAKGIGDAQARFAATSNVVVVAADGSVTAFDSGTGAPLWSRTTSGGASLCTVPDIAAAADRLVLSVATVGDAVVANRRYDNTSNGCLSVVATLDPRNGHVVSDHQVRGAVERVAVSPGGSTFVAGSFVQSLAVDGAAPSAQAPAQAAFALRFGPSGTLDWVRSFEAGWIDSFQALLATDESVFVRTRAAVVPTYYIGPGGTVAALSAADGTSRWQTGLPDPHVPSSEGSEALALGPHGDLVVGITFRDVVDTPGRRITVGQSSLTARGGSDAALFGVDAASGSPRYLDQVGGGADDRVVGLAAAGRDLVLSGLVDVSLTGGESVARAAVARIPAVQHVGITLANVERVGGTAVAQVVTESGLPAAVSTLGPCVEISGNGEDHTLRLDHVGTCTVVAAQAGGADWEPGTSTVSFEIHPRLVQLDGYWSPGVSWPNPVPADLGARFVDSRGWWAPGSVTYSIPAGTVLLPGTYAVTAYFHSSDPDYADGQGTGTLRVNRARPTLQWGELDSVVYGSPIPAAELDATATGVDGEPVPGSFTYTTVIRDSDSSALVGVANRVLEVGSYEVEAHFTSSDPRYGQATVVRTLTVTKAATGMTARLVRARSQLTAMMTDTSNARPLAGQWVSFYFGDRTCVAVTDAAGTATCTLSVLELATALRTGVWSVYYGDRNHSESAFHIDPAV